MNANPRIELSGELAILLNQLYPNQTGFPQDVTLQTVRTVRDDPNLRRLYDEAIRDQAGEIDVTQKEILHRLIGRTIRRVLNADVIGRSVELDPNEELIKTHALLVPSRI